MQRRKDHKGRVLKDGEVYRKSDGLYMYRWTAKNGKRHTIYDATLEGLREKEEKKKKKKGRKNRRAEGDPGNQRKRERMMENSCVRQQPIKNTPVPVNGENT